MQSTCSTLKMTQLSTKFDSKTTAPSDIFNLFFSFCFIFRHKRHRARFINPLDQFSTCCNFLQRDVKGSNGMERENTVHKSTTYSKKKKTFYVPPLSCAAFFLLLSACAEELS